MLVITDQCQFDNYDLSSFVSIAAGFGQQRYSYVVTPNTDHLIRLHDDTAFRELYAEAGYVLLDSRFLSHLLRLTRGLHLPVCAGSDLTEKLLSTVVAEGDRVVLIGGSDEQARQLARRYHLLQLAHHNPPMGFVRDPAALETCLSFIEANSPFRFCFLCVGAPQQEFIARQLKLRGRARGLALCAGASINFLTGSEKRAPGWMQKLGLEWLYRLLQAPHRMVRRYLVRGPRIFGLLRHTEIHLRQRLPQRAPAPAWLGPPRHTPL
jgi:exopolysaccharide biosynthesis WecB/TagA/CpsF family protein